MKKLYKLRNQVKLYAWGSPEWLPQLMNLPNADGAPWAELWMGSHSASPSIVNADGIEIGLGELIAQNPECHLGADAAQKFGSLPFLFKLLAADKPLSIQAHPNLAQAREGFSRENKAGLALDAPVRNYKDSNHKPEIICALTPFTGMCGFRPPDEIRRLLKTFLASAAAPLCESLAPLFTALEEADTGKALRDFLSALFAIQETAREMLTAYIQMDAASANSNANGVVSAELRRLMCSFTELYPNDPAIIAPLYLNVFHLEPGEAVFLRAGILHAYVHGLGVELMANSDNVLRGGLTPKHVDVPELMHVLEFAPMNPEIIKPQVHSGVFRYPAPAGLFGKPDGEFSLSVLHGTGGEMPFAEKGPAICVVTEGEAAVKSADGDEAVLKRGESVFISANGGGIPLVCKGNFTLYTASLPQ